MWFGFVAQWKKIGYEYQDDMDYFAEI